MCFEKVLGTFLSNVQEAFFALILFPTLTFVDVSILKVAISQLSLFNLKV